MDVGWLQRQRPWRMEGEVGLALAILWRAILDAQETTEIDRYYWPPNTGYEEAREFLRCEGCEELVDNLSRAMGEDLSRDRLLDWAERGTCE